MADDKQRKIPSFLKTVYLSNREIRLLLAGLYYLNMPPDEIEGTLWKKLLFEKLHKKSRRKKEQVSKITTDSLRMKAAIEFGSEYMYTIRNGGHGQTLYIHAENKESASKIRLKAPDTWEDLFVIVTYNTGVETDDEFEAGFQ